MKSVVRLLGSLSCAAAAAWLTVLPGRAGQQNADATSIYLGPAGTTCHLTTGTGAPSGGSTCDVYVDRTSGEVYRKLASGGWTAIGTASGDVSGPGSSVDSEIALWNGTGGATLKRATGSGVLWASSGVYQTPVTVPSDATKFLNGAATPAYAQVKDSDLSTSDITTNDVSTSKHGFAPKAPNDATKYLDGTGAYSTPSGSGNAINVVLKGSNQDVTNSATLVDDTALTMSLAANKTYWFEIYLLLEANSTAADFKYTIDGPSGSAPAGATAQYGNDTESSTAAGWWGPTTSGSPVNMTGLGSTVAIGTSSTTATLQGLRISGLIFMGGSSGTILLRWAQNTATSSTTTTVKANSLLRYQLLN